MPEPTRLSIVGTVHAESGLANVAELKAILERLRPDVIFAEIPAAYVHQYCDGSHGTLEAIAVAQYLAHHHVSVIPVDRSKPENAFFRNAQDMFANVERTSAHYRHLVDHHSHNTRIDGFVYLNSDRCLQTWNDITSEILATLDWIRAPSLREVYDLWIKQNELRDRHMTDSIVDYSMRNDFVQSVFLVGAAHRKSIIDKAERRIRTGSLQVDWKVNELRPGRSGE